MKRLLLLLAIIAGLAACGTRKSPPLDDKVYRVFADSLETAIAAGDVEFLKSHFDRDFLVGRICDSLDISGRKKKNRANISSKVTLMPSWMLLPQFLNRERMHFCGY